MAGRAYTMKEMKQIVDYLVEHRAYAEIGGRKMWMDLANSKIINRTWQSLKETFIKRILLDIHNPYYNLTAEQICSFRQKRDLAEKSQNRLEIQTVSDDSNASENQRAIKQTNEKEDQNAGEEKSSKIQTRTSSTDTLVLENYYQTAEDLQKVLESPKQTTTQKSLRDFITYSEPLTPMLQEVLHDFASDDEPQLEIDETAGTHFNDENKSKSTTPETIRESQSYTKKTDNDQNGEESNQQASKIKSLKLKKTQKGTWENKEPVNDASSAVQNTETNNNESEMAISGKEDLADNQKNDVEKTTDQANNDTNVTNDTPLPNNQEELVDKPQHNRDSIESLNKKKKEKSRKRSHSQSSAEQKKKKKGNHHDSSEAHEQEKETETFNSHPQATSLQNNLVNTTSPAAVTQQNDQTEDTIIPPNVAVADNTKGVEGTSQEAGPSGINTANPTELNPCLKNVNLFEEQFTLSYSDSEDAAQNKTQVENAATLVNNKNTLKTNHENEKSNEIYTSNKSKETVKSNITDKAEKPTTSKNLNRDVKSLSDTNSDFEQPKRKNSLSRYKKSAIGLANVFGFSSGLVSRKRRNHGQSNSRHCTQRRRLNSRNIPYDVESGSSDEYSTASDSEDVTIVSNRVNGHRRRYMKPPSYDILHHENLQYAVGKKKIYPLVLRENGSLYQAEAGEHIDDRIDSYWKAKYEEEKKKHAEEKIRADELARLLRQVKENPVQNEPLSPILQPNLGTTLNQREQTKPIPVTEKDSNLNEKIKFIIYEDIEMECQLTSFETVIEKIKKFKEKSNANYAVKSRQETDDKISKNNDTQNASTSKQESKAMENMDTSVLQNMNNNEKGKKSISLEAPNANKRVSVSPKKTINVKEQPIQIKYSVAEVNEKHESSSSVVISSGSITPIDPEIRDTAKIESEIFEKIAEMDKSDRSIQDSKSNTPSVDVNVTKRKRGRPKKVTPLPNESASEKVRALSVEAVRRPRSTVPAATPKKARTLSVGSRYSDVDLRRPIKPPRRFSSDEKLATQSKPKRSKSKQSLSRVAAASKDEDTPEEEQVRYKFPPKTKPNTRSSKRKFAADGSRPHLTSPNITSQSESTQGYHDSDISPTKVTIRKKRKMSTANLVVKKGQIKRVKRKSCPYLADDSCSTMESQSQKSGASNASQTLNSEVYKSESYQMLMPKAKQLSTLDKIEETSLQNETRTDLNNLTPLTINVNNEYYVRVDDDAANSLSIPRGSEPNSSNISLPLSPELSVVEHLSISKDQISGNLEAHPSINEMQSSNETPPIYNKYLISDVDVTMPLMGQHCDLQNQFDKLPSRRTTFSESLERAQYSSESLDQKLRDLLLESAKKMASDNVEGDKENAMDVDPIVPSKNKTKNKRRSSTPRKKLAVRQFKTSGVGPVIDEHTESCSHSGRRSCPPVIQVIPCEEAAEEPNNSNATEPVPNRGRNKKKDIIKVKILRPRNKSRSKQRTNSRLSVCTDSGINEESGLFEGCQCCDISTELIHNHSDTCLQDNCAADSSVEVVENLNKSVISLSSTSFPSEVIAKPKSSQSTNDEMVAPEMFCSNARHATNLNSAKKASKVEAGSDDVVSLYHTPPSAQSFNSMITEDLSDEGKPAPKWYILSEDETNFVDARSQQSYASCGSNLNQIFSSCAVPDLSTITEMSKETDTRNMNTDNDADSIPQSIFDPDF